MLSRRVTRLPPRVCRGILRMEKCAKGLEAIHNSHDTPEQANMSLERVYSIPLPLLEFIKQRLTTDIHLLLTGRRSLENTQE